jgi:hypothetical protein
MMATVLTQNGCEKAREYVPEEDFLNALKGEWCVTDFVITGEINISLRGDKVYYNSTTGEGYVSDSVNDPHLCTLPEIEHMGEWKIFENNDELLLITQNFCAGEKNYKMEYSNYHHKMDDKFNIYADVNLSDSNTRVSLSDFVIYSGYGNVIMLFTIIQDERSFNFSLSKDCTLYP